MNRAPRQSSRCFLEGEVRRNFYLGHTAEEGQHLPVWETRLCLPCLWCTPDKIWLGYMERDDPPHEAYSAGQYAIE